MKTLIQKQILALAIFIGAMLANTLSDCKQNVTINQKYTNGIPNSNSENLDATTVPTLPELMEKIRQL